MVSEVNQIVLMFEKIHAVGGGGRGGRVYVVPYLYIKLRQFNGSGI